MELHDVSEASESQINVDFLALPHWQTIRLKVTEEAYIVEAMVLLQPSHCPCCGSSDLTLRPKGSQRKSIRDIHAHGKRVLININVLRYLCLLCRRTSPQVLPGVHARRRATVRLVDFIGVESFHKPFSLVANETGVSEKVVRSIFTDTTVQLAQSVRFRTPRRLGLDFCYIRGRARCMLADLDNKQLIEILPANDVLSLCRCLLQLEEHERIEVIVIDLISSYRKVIKKVFPHAHLVVDKWQVWRLADRALATALQEERARLPIHEGVQVPRSLRMLLRQFKEDRLENLSQLCPELLRAHKLYRQFLKIWMFKDCKKAEQRYEEWVASIPEELHHAFDSLIGIINSWHEEIFNYFKYPLSNDFVETVNSQVTMLQRTSRGYSFETIRAKLLYGPVVKRALLSSVKFSKLRGGIGDRAKPKLRARRAAAPQCGSSDIENLWRICESQESTDNLISMPEQWVERFAVITPKKKKKEETGM